MRILTILLTALCSLLILYTTYYITSTIFTNSQSAKSSQQNDEGFCSMKQDKACSTGENACFRVATVEYQRVDFEDDVTKTVNINLDAFSEIAREASRYGAGLIVFPEDGLFIGQNKAAVDPVLTEIPDPKVLGDSNRIPCDQPQDSSSFILRRLSCIAKNNNMYLIANFGTKEICDDAQKLGGRDCPESGHLTLNTDVVLSPKGEFIGRYRKYNMFIEIFDKAPYLENTYFDTPYGRFGIFTCFDLLFKEPALTLVEEHHIDTAIFPTWWYDELPFLTAIQSQDGWSALNRVNMISSNIHRLELGSTGSGIFTASDTVYTGADSNHSKLIIANLARNFSQAQCNFDAKIIKFETNLPESNYVYKHYELLQSDSIFQLQKSEEKIKLCSSENSLFCCNFVYKVKDDPDMREKLANLVLIVRSSLRPGYYHWYEQVCALATLQKAPDIKRLKDVLYSKTALVEFEKVSIEGTFDTNYVLPLAAHNVSRLVNRKERSFNCTESNASRIDKTKHSCRLDYSNTGQSDGDIYSFGLYGRVFEFDKMPEGW